VKPAIRCHNKKEGLGITVRVFRATMQREGSCGIVISALYVPINPEKPNNDDEDQEKKLGDPKKLVTQIPHFRDKE